MEGECRPPNLLNFVAQVTAKFIHAKCHHDKPSRTDNARASQLWLRVNLSSAFAPTLALSFGMVPQSGQSICPSNNVHRCT